MHAPGNRYKSWRWLFSCFFALLFFAFSAFSAALSPKPLPTSELSLSPPHLFRRETVTKKIKQRNNKNDAEMNRDEPNLFTHLNEARAPTYTEGTGLSMVVLCARFKETSDLASILTTHRTVVEDEVNSESANITGILIVQGNSLLHLLEGPPASVLRILKHLSKTEDFSGQDSVQTGAVVYTVEDRPERVFPEWYSSVVQEKKASVDELTEENCKDVVHDMALNLLEIGKGLQTEVSEDIDLSRYAYRVPGKTLLAAFATR